MGRRLAHNMRYILNKQRRDGRKVQEVHHGATKADYYHIYSDKSLKTHLRPFCKWADNNRINQINHDVVGRYCLYLQKHGYSAWTMKAGITAIKPYNGFYWSLGQKRSVYGQPMERCS